MKDQDSYGFDWTIAPVTREVFLAEYFEKKPLIVRRSSPQYYADLLTFADIDRVVTTMGLTAPELSVTRADADLSAADYTMASGAIDPVRVAHLFADGATIILSGLQERLPQLAQFCRALEGAFSARVQTNIYMTPARAQGFKPHYDTHDVMVLQVAGTKQWRLYDTPVELPLPGQAFDPDRTRIGAETARFLLEPGDMLYIPRGLAHDAVATDRTSLHITTGLMLRSWADLLVETVEAFARSDPDFRAALPPDHASAGADATRHHARMSDLLGRMADPAALETLFKGARHAFLAGRVPRVPGQLEQVSDLDALTLDALVSVRPNLPYDLGHSAETDQVRLLCHGAEISLPRHVLGALTHCLTAGTFRVGDLPGDLDDPGKLVLVRRLIREGVMHVLRSPKDIAPR